ncbi:MAG: saccharopine dehydrogenase NADP-binding domain-containing protein, partial [Pseudomonadota bacterium]
MFERVVILGLGGVGGLVAALLRDLGVAVRGVDLRHRRSAPHGIDVRVGDLSDSATLQTALTDQEAVISCLPYQQNLAVARAAHAKGLHYFDPTEDIATTQAIRQLAEGADHVMIPQNGLAPGFIGILGAELANRFDADGLRHIRLRVGALPQNPIGQLGYAANWSLNGLVREYTADCEAIIDGER